MTAVAEPHVHFEAERSTLGAIVLADNVIEPLLVEVGLRPEHFYLGAHRTLFAAMVALHDNDRPIDVLTLSEQLGGSLEAVGGREGLDELAGWAPAAGNALEYGRIVLDRAMWRTRQDAATAMLAAAGRRDEAAFGTAEATIALADRAEDSTSTAAQLADDVFDYLGEVGAPDCIPTPFEEINDLLAGGLYPGDTTVITAWTSFGKSIVMHQLLEHATPLGYTAHIYTNEMSKRDYTLRAIAAYSGVPFRRLKARRLTDDQRRRAMRGLERFSKLGIGITDCAGWSAHDISRHLRRHRWDVCGVDLLNLIPHRDVADIDEISLTLNNAARQSRCHVLLLCQLNQARNDGTVPPRPVKRDIRGSGQIANDASNVLMLHREMVELTVAGKGTGAFEPAPKGELYLEKARNGELGGCAVVLNDERIRFDETARPRFEATL